MTGLLTSTSVLALGLHFMAQLAVIIRVLLRRHRDPASRVAWIAVVMFAPVIGIVVYLLFGEVNIGRRRILRMRRVLASLPAVPVAIGPDGAEAKADVPERHEPLVVLGKSVSGFHAVGGNRATLMRDSNATIDAMVADIDAARNHVHILFYIWLPDTNGCKIVEALKRAASRGVTCRAMADDVGSRLLIRSPHWRVMAQARVRLARALPVGNPLLRPLRGRIDLRNHRKIVVIDGRITYCGSQNCADPEFRVKPKYAPWVDAMMRFEGPIARQNQYLFAADWMACVDDDLTALLGAPLETAEAGFAAQVIGTGPTVRHSAMSEVFEALLYAARRELVISTPYYVPDDPMQAALCASARRGVTTTIIFPAKNDSRIVAAASRSYYEELLGAGVRVFEYVGGLLHTKSLTLDGEVTLIGSANMDRRSFDLNYENNILYFDPALTAAMRRRQDEYLAASQQIDGATVAQWGWRKRLWNNTVAILGPVL